MSYDVPEAALRELAELIHSDASPVGIDAKKTHILILHKLLEIERKVDELIGRLDDRRV